MATGKPLADANIAVEAGDGRNYQTVAVGQSDAHGGFRVEHLSPGAYRVVVTAPGFADIVAGYSRLVTDGYLALEDVELSPQAAITGVVADDGGKPVAGASIRLADVLGINGVDYPQPKSPSATTDASGKFEISGVPQGATRVVLWGFPSSIVRIRDHAGERS